MAAKNEEEIKETTAEECEHFETMTHEEYEAVTGSLEEDEEVTFNEISE